MEREPFMDYGEVLVTGGTGFVGRHVCRALIARGYVPRLLVRVGSEEKIPPDIRERCRVTLGDVTNRESVENAVQCVDAVVHLVGIIREVPSNGITFEKLHVAATRNIVWAAQRWEATRFIHMSALGVGPEGVTPYLETKRQAEEIVRDSGLQYTIFRPSVIFGEGDHFIGELARLLPRLPFVPVVGDGAYRLQPVYAGDVARGFAEALLRPKTAGRTFEVGGPGLFTYDELLDAIAAASGRSARKVHVPVPLVRTAVRLMERFERFPVTDDQITMLLKGSVCFSRPYYDDFGFEPLSLADFLAGKRPAPPREEKPAADPPLPARSSRKAA